MELYTVQAGDTIYTIANRYGVPVDQLIRDNDLTDPNRLVPGEVIIILYPSQTYTVQEGDSLASIAASFNITINELLRNNPELSERNYIYPGETLIISYHRTNNIATHGYANTFINQNTLKKTLPYLTYLSIFNYRTVKNGDIVGDTGDKEIIQLAKDYGVVPLMHLSTFSVLGEVDLELTYDVILNEEIQNKLFDNVLRVVRENGYLGVNISAQYINTSNQMFFNQYTKKLSDLLQQEGYISVITVNPNIDSYNNEIVYEQINYPTLVELVDSMLLLQYKWSINNEPPAPVISISNLSYFIDNALSQTPKDKLFVGIPTLGYIWELPYVQGFSKVNSINIESAVNLARDVGATIEFDEASQTPYFTYEDTSTDIPYIVWFINAITINSMISMLLNKGIHGTGVWNIMTYFDHLWLVINSQYNIIKLLPEY